MFIIKLSFYGMFYSVLRWVLLSILNLSNIFYGKVEVGRLG